MDVLTFGESMVAFSNTNNQSFIQSNQSSVSVAGAESNVAIALSRLNHRVKWISRVGEDSFGEKILHTLRAEGVDTKGVAKDKRFQTGIMFKQKNTLLDTEVLYYRENSAASLMSINDINLNWIKECRVIHITGITPSLSDSCRKMVMEVIRLGKEYNKIISFDPNIRFKLWDVEEAKKVLVPIIKQVDIFFPGLDELKILFNSEKIDDFVDLADEWEIPMMVVKDGGRGAWLIEKEHKTKFVPSFKVEHVVDEIGAGDAFAAGFIHGYLGSEKGVECVSYGHALAAFVVSTEGDTNGLPTKKELYRFLEGEGKTIR